MIQQAYDLFLTTLANMNRLKIVYSLRKQKLSVSEILIKTGLNQTTVSHNLQRLRLCGFVSFEQIGKCRYYQLNQETIKPLMNIMDKHVKSNCKHTIVNNSEPPQSID